MSKRAERRKKSKQKSVSSPSETHEIHHKKRNFFVELYDNHYKLLLIIPVLMLILAIVQISAQYATTGDFINKGVSLSGGVSITIEKEIDVSFSELETYLNSEFPTYDSTVRGLTQSGQNTGLVVDSTVDDVDLLLSVIEEKVGVIGDDEYTKEVMGSSLGDQFFKQTFKALIIAFIFMGLVVLIYFRSFIPSLSVILSAIFDIIVTAAIINVSGMKLSSAGIAAFLMLIGYSVDTDILLTAKMLGGKGSFLSRIQEAMKTGMVMSATTILAVFAALILTQSIVIKQILTIVLVGLLVDIISTWIQNAGLLRWYLEKKQ